MFNKKTRELIKWYTISILLIGIIVIFLLLIVKQNDNKVEKIYDIERSNLLGA